MFWIELIIVLAIIFLGVRIGGTFLAMAGGIGMFISIVVIGTPKGWNVSRRYFTPTFYFCDVHVSAVLWVQLLLRDTLLSAVPRCL